MDRECNKCIYHISGSCSRWNCEGTETLEHHDRKLLDELNEFLVEEKGEYVGSDMDEFLKRRVTKNE